MGLLNNGIIDGVKGMFKRPNNPSIDKFIELNRDTSEAKEHSVINQLARQQMMSGDSAMAAHSTTSSYKDFVYDVVSTNKLMRIKGYRDMAGRPEINLAVEEICDEAVSRNANGDLATLQYRTDRLDDYKKENILEEYNHYIGLFNLDKKLWSMVRSVVVEGQLAYENIIDDERPEFGIIGVKEIKNESFEFIIDLLNEKVGILVFPETSTANFNSKYVSVSGNIGVSNLTRVNGSQSTDMRPEEGIPMPFSELTYMDSQDYSSDGLVTNPILERARLAYRQLSLVEDAILIYRIARAPERYVFSVPMGRLNRGQQEQELQRVAHRHNTSQFYNPHTGTVSNDYDPYQMVESFFFARDKDGNGVDVTTIGGSVQWTELPDLEHFERKLFMSLRVPFGSRLKNADTSNVEKTTTISQEDARFSRFTVRIQNCVSSGLTDGFITHLKLVGMWDRYELNDRDFYIELVPPTKFELYEQQQLINIQFENYDKATRDNPEFSRQMFAEKYLDMSSEEWGEHQSRRVIEREFEAWLEHREDNIRTKGNPHLVGRIPSGAGDSDDSGGSPGGPPGGDE